MNSPSGSLAGRPATSTVRVAITRLSGMLLSRCFSLVEETAPGCSTTRAIIGYYRALGFALLAVAVGLDVVFAAGFAALRAGLAFAATGLAFVIFVAAAM